MSSAPASKTQYWSAMVVYMIYRISTSDLLKSSASLLSLSVCWDEGTATFGITTFTSSEDRDIFIARLSSYGLWQWVVKAGGSSDDYGMDIVVDFQGVQLLNVALSFSSDV